MARGVAFAVHAAVLAFAMGMAIAAEPAPVPGGGWQPAPAPAPVPVLPGAGAPPGKAVPPPPFTQATEAYLFRTRLLSAAPCQRFASEADAVFLDDKTDTGTKAAMLAKIEAEAGRYNCLGPRQ